MSEGIKKSRREHCLNPPMDIGVEFESDCLLLYPNERYLFRVESVLEKRVLGNLYSILLSIKALTPL